MSANPHANGGVLRKDLKLPDFRKLRRGCAVAGQRELREHQASREYLRDVMKNNPTSFRCFGPDETASNRCRLCTKPARIPGWPTCCRRTPTAASSRPMAE
jgi:phosphoketolase